MRTIVKYLILSILISGCFYDKKNNISDKHHEFNSIDEIYGTWIFTPYLDSIVKYKKIYDITFDDKNYVASYAYKISINKINTDSINTRGFLSGDWTFHIKKVTNDELIVESDWFKTIKFINRDGQCEMIVELSDEVLSDHKTTLKTFKFDKKDVTMIDEWTYFGEKIFSGEYYNAKDNSTVIFNNDKINGLDPYFKYDLSTDFVDSYPFDNLTLFEKNKSTYKTFNWIFHGDTLKLNEILMTYDDGGLPDKIEIGNSKYILIKKK